MSTTTNPLQPISDAVTQLGNDLTTLSTDLQSKLAAVATEIQGLKAGQPVTQDQINALVTAVQAADASAKQIDSTVNAFSA